MIKHSKIINTLTLEQRLKLVISSRKFERNSIDEFEFNNILIEKNVFLNRTGYLTYFPSNKALASSWNNEIFKKAGKLSAIENNALQGAKVFDLQFDSNDNSVSEDYLLNGKFIASFVEGVNEGNGLSCIKLDTKETSNLENKLASFNYAIQSNPNFVIVNSLDDIKFLKTKDLDSGVILLGQADNVNLAITLIQFGSSIVFVNENDFDTTVAQAVLAVQTYEKAIVELNNGTIDEPQLNALIQGGQALSEEQVNLACDKIVDILFSIDNAHKNQTLEPNINFYPKTHKVVFDEIAHDSFAVESARESIILLKNNGVLPLTRNSSVSVVGDLAKNQEYYFDYSGRYEIYTDLIFDCINNYESINTVGYVHGYLKNDQADNDLMLKAKKLVSTSDSCLVFLCADKNSTSLPDAQIELLRQLSSTGKKIIAVVVANKLIDFSFAQYCSAILFSYGLSQGFSRAVLDIISGKISPSAKMVETTNDENVDNIPNYSVNKSEYPFGFGLSYAKFNYVNFSLSHAGASVTIENVGKFDAYETVQLYVSKENSKISHTYKQLKGYAKVFIKQGETQRVFIPFDDNTFNVYNEEQASFEIEGGKYIVSVGNSSNEQKFTSTIKLKRYSNKVIFANRVIEEGDEKSIDKQISKIADNTDQQRLIKKNMLLSYKQKIGLSIFLLLYFNVLSFLLVFAHFKDLSLFEIDLFTLIVGCSNLVLSIISIVCMFVYISKRKKPVYIAYDHTNDTLSKIVDRVGTFHQESTTTFYQEVEPALEEIIEEPIVEEETIDAQEEEAQVVAEITEQVTSNKVQTVLIDDIYRKYTAFIRSKGLYVETFYLRSVFSAIFNSSLIFLNCANKQNLERFILATQEFFACKQKIIEFSNDANNAEEFFSYPAGAERVATVFAKDLANAGLSNNLSIFAMSDVTVDGVAKTLSDFIIFNDNPSINRVVSISKDCKIALKKNIVLILVPREENYTEIMPEVLARASISINLNIRDIQEETSCDYLPIPISYQETLDHLSEIKNTCFLQENSWKLFDELEDLLNTKEGFALGNKFTIFAENFSSLFINFDGEDYDACDSLLAFKLLPILKCLNLYKKENGDQEVSSLLEKIFSKDNLDKTLLNVKKVVIESEKEILVQPIINDETLDVNAEQPESTSIEQDVDITDTTTEVATDKVVGEDK